MATASLDVLGGASSSGGTPTDVLQALAADAGVKAPVAAAATANLVALAGLLVLDGYQTAAGDRVLVWKQTDATQNGIYNVSAGAWTRAIDCDGKGDLYKGTAVTVGNGATYANVIFLVGSANPITVGTSALSFVAYMFAPGSYINANGSVPITGAFKLASSGGLLRWQWSRVDSETGSGNAGSNLELDAYADDGTTSIGTVFKIGRGSRVVDFAFLPTIGGASLASQLATFGASGTGHARGIVPDPGATAGTTRFLREDASFAIPVGRGGASGLKIANNATTPNSSIDVSARSMVVGNAATGLFYVANPSFTINLLQNQVENGIAEATTKQVSTWYYLYAMSKPDGTTKGIATSIAPPTAPGVPSGYIAWEYLGAVYVFSDGNLRRTLQYGAQGQYQPTSGVTNNTSYPLMASGTASVWTALAVASFVPPTATQIRVKGAGVGGSSTAQYTVVSPNNADSTLNHAPIYIGGSGSGTIVFGGSTADFVLEGANIYWGSTLSGEVRCLGWHDSVNAT